MTAPLYQGCDWSVSNDGNCGLLFNRFADFYESDFTIAKKKKIDGKEENPGAHWLRKNFGGRKVGDAARLKQLTDVQRQLADSLGGKSLVCKAGWHFVTGMGNAHPVENGFAWHPTLGVPYLTGAAVKGLVRSYIETNLRTDEAADNPDKETLLFEWFGSSHKDSQEPGYESQAGELIFFDALPVEPVLLGVDVMTPHMGKWYEKGATEPNTPATVPADWHDPVPVSFLVANDISLQFSFAFRQYTSTEDRPEIKLSDVTKALELVLSEMGAGAKTSTGYGEMIEVGKLAQRKHDAEQAQAFEGAEYVEGYYLKRDRGNKSLHIERGSDKERARISGLKAKEIELLKEFPSSVEDTLERGEPLKVNAWINRKEILRVEPCTS